MKKLISMKMHVKAYRNPNGKMTFPALDENVISQYFKIFVTICFSSEELNSMEIIIFCET